MWRERPDVWAAIGILCAMSACGGPTRTLGASGSAGETDGGQSGGTQDDGDVWPARPGAELACAELQAGSCDVTVDAVDTAFGLNCEAGPAATVRIDAHPDAVHVLAGQVGHLLEPRLGSRMVVLSTGHAEKLTDPTYLLPDSALEGHDPGYLPPPIDPHPVAEDATCTEHPDLLGTGDCSNSLGPEWYSPGSVYDYAAVEVEAEVPMGAVAAQWDFAFITSEYPGFWLWDHNDMHVAWLESELWTGNVAFDASGMPISVHSVFLEYKGACHAQDPDCTPSDVLHGTSVFDHGATRWLTADVPVVPGETIHLTLAIFDAFDELEVSFVIFDNFRYRCAGGAAGPTVVRAEP